MTKAYLGTKHLCPHCGTKYYDLNRSPIVCPRCGTVFEVAAKPRPPAPVKAAAEPAEEESVVRPEVETVSLEEADKEAAASGKVKAETDEVAEDNIGVDEVEDIDSDDESEDTTFLAEDEDDDEDVGTIIGDVEDHDT